MAFKLLVCPNCGCPERMAELDIVHGNAKILGTDDKGQLVWTGETNMDWDSQEPADDPPRFICLACESIFLQAQLPQIKSADHDKGDPTELDQQAEL